MTYLLFVFLCIVLKIRYRIIIKGMKECLAKSGKGILFLPNHPALIDPVIISRILFRRFRPRALVDEKQIRQNVILRHLVNSLRILPLPDMGIAGKAGLEKVIHQIEECVNALKAGDNLLMYPAGRIYRSRYESLRGNGGVAHILKEYPDVRIVLIRTRGLWGSTFGRGRGYQEPFLKVLTSHIKHVLLNLFFFMPKRTVEIEFSELPDDFPKNGTKDEINRYLERFYNFEAPPNTYVPYYWWEKGGARVVPEPDTVISSQDTSDVPEDVRKKVYAKLHEMTDKRTLQESYTLGTDLGLDSLMVADLLIWVQNEFGVQVNSPETLRTVANVLMAAIGQSASAEPLKPIPPQWFIKEDANLLQVPEGARKLTDTFLIMAKQNPNYALVADQLSGVITSRKAILAIMALSPSIKAIPEERIGLIMPACVAVFVVYMSMLFAGKVPVLINWTVGSRNMKHCIDKAGIKHVLTSKTVVERLEGRGTDFSEIKDTFIYLEDIKKGISIFRKLYSLFCSHFNWSSLRNAKVSEYVGILFTSGSENMPKTVPLTHWNVISCVTSAMRALGLRRDDSVIGILPPFHSFGLLMNVVMPGVANLRVIYHANPTEGDMLARLVAAYRATMIVGTPTFAAGIFRNATPAQVQSLRIIITGAEKCPLATWNMMKEKNPNLYLLEGYGITECSPVVALNRPGNEKLGTVGTIIDCLEWLITDENDQPVPQGTTGMLNVRGDSIFPGYLDYDGPSPFVQIQGKEWYRTGDLVQADEAGRIIFMGRLKRFVKIGGEMVSLPAIEEVLLKLYRTKEQPNPLAVEAHGDDAHPEIVLFSVLDLQKEDINLQLREAGFAPIYNIKQVIKIPEIPLLGSGKTDYRTLKAMLTQKS